MEKGWFPQAIRIAVHNAQNGKCYLCLNEIVDFHHKVPNTKCNRKLLPLFLISPFNCVGLCRECHEKKKGELYIPMALALVYEEYLHGL